MEESHAARRGAKVETGRVSGEPSEEWSLESLLTAFARDVAAVISLLSRVILFILTHLRRIGPRAHMRWRMRA